MTLIKREDAIEARPEYRNVDMLDNDKVTYNKGWNDCNDIWRAIINALPSAEAEWIPCSKRLPNVGEDVLFCDSEWTQEGCLREDGDWWQFRWSTVRKKEDVTAWMPLPKPYREDGDI